MSTLLNDKPVALIIGCSQGIGLSMLENLLRQGDSKFVPKDAYIVGTVRSRNDAINALVEEFPDRLFIELLEVTNDEQINKLAQFIETKFNRLDCYIHNAGIACEQFTGAANPKIDADAYIKTHLVNVVAPQNCFCALLPLLQRTHVMKGGSLEDKRPEPIEGGNGLSDDKTNVRVLVVSSLMASLSEHTYGNPLPIYASSKTALNSIFKNLGHYYPYMGISVVHPGWVATNMGGDKAPVTPVQSASGILSAWNDHGYACNSMKAMFTWENKTVGW